MNAPPTRNGKHLATQQNPAKGTPSLAARRMQVHKQRTELSLLTLRWWSHGSQAISSETLDRSCQEEIPPQSRPGPNRKSPPPTFCRVAVGGKSKMLTQGSANTRGEPSCHYEPCRKCHKLAALHGKLDLSPCACATQQRATAQTAQDKPGCNAHTSHLDTCTVVLTTAPCLRVPAHPAPFRDLQALKQTRREESLHKPARNSTLFLFSQEASILSGWNKTRRSHVLQSR